MEIITQQNAPKISIAKKLMMVLLILIVTQITFQIGVYVAYFVRDNYFAGDDYVFNSVFKLIYLITILIALFVATRFVKSDWGFSLENLKLKKKSFIILLICWFLLFVLLLVANYISPDSQYTGLKWYQAILGFIYLTFGAGITEEILFRALAITLLYGMFGSLIYKYKFTSNDMVISKKKKVENPKKYEWVFSISIATIISAVIFSLQHISYRIYPFVIFRLNWSQVVFALIFGLIAGIIFEKTKSVYHVIVIHCIIDSISGFSILFSFLFRMR
ncbi:MAG: CPBP family intramembrane metalloprotease [Oscillospiraceae bacterium]|nr:CPBP family intramembrane metalloprotease [Oscillospiraceae bacterium]